jgi:hypothetical protein
MGRFRARGQATFFASKDKLSTSDDHAGWQTTAAPSMALCALAFCVLIALGSSYLVAGHTVHLASVRECLRGIRHFVLLPLDSILTPTSAKPNDVGIASPPSAPTKNLKLQGLLDDLVVEATQGAHIMYIPGIKHCSTGLTNHEFLSWPRPHPTPHTPPPPIR